MRKMKWLAAFLIVATLFGGILGCKQEVEIPSDKTAPADVTELTVQAANGNAVLNWKNPADADFAGVQIAMSPAEGTLKNAVVLGKEVTSLDVSGLTVGKEYTFTVKAFDESLNYSEGAEAKATVADTADYTAPAAVTSLTVTAANGNAVLNWKNPADPDFAGVQVAMSPAEGTLKNAVSLGKDVVSFDVSGLENGKEYTFTVKAFDESLNYSEGAEAKATVADTADYTAPAEVTELTVIAADGNAVLAWKNPADADFAGVQVAMSPVEGTLKNAVSLGKEVTSLDVSGLENGKEYTFTVKAFDQSLNYSKGAEAKATVADTADYTAPADVTELVATNKDASVLLTWTDATDKDIYGYEVTWKATVESRAAVMEANSMMVAPGSEGCFISNLTNGTEYAFTVKSVDTSGNKSSGVAATITPKAIVAPVSLVPSTTEKTNQDVTVNVEINPEIAEKVEQILYGSGIITSLKNLSKDITNEKSFSVEQNSSNTVATKYTDGTFDIFYIVIPNIDKTAPAKVENVKTTYSKETGKITLSWENPTAEDFVGTKIVYGLEGSEETTTLTFDKDTTETVLENIKTDTEGTYTVEIFTRDDVGNEKGNETTILTTIPSITSLSIPVAGISYAGQMLPVTIKGENLDSGLLYLETTGVTLQNITVVSSTKITAEIPCPSTVGTSEVTVTYGESSASTNLKVVETEKCFVVGDVLLTDGTRIKAENAQYGVPSGKNAFAVIASALYGGGTGKAIGLQKSASSLMWAPEDTTGYNTNFTEIQASYGGSSSSGYTFKGDLDGSDNWEYICSIDPEGTQDAATNYPVFNFALSYGTTAGLTETDYETGWYVPSVAEVYEVYKNKDVIQTSLDAAKGFTIGTSDYYCSSQKSSSDDYSYEVYFYNGSIYNLAKKNSDYVFVFQAFNAEQFNNYEYTTEISSVEIPAIGEGFAGEVPVTITGKDLIQEITISGLTISTIDYISDAKAIAYATTTGTETETTITVSCGTVSKTGTLKVVSTEKCFSVGDVLLTDGTRIKAENAQYGIPSDKNAFAVIISASYGGGTGKAIGLQKSASSLMWAPEDTTGYNTNFTEIQASYSGSSSSGYTFEGDLDGSDNWEYICSIDPEGTQDAATNYPIFNFANTYGTTAGLTETDYETGWYVPSVAEVYEVYKNKDVIQTSLTKAGGFTIGEREYWSSSHSYNYSYLVNFYYGSVGSTLKDRNYNVFVLQALNAEQFNNYEYNTAEISSVEIPTIAEGFVGEVPVKITGKDLIQKITVSGLTISTIDYISDAKAIAYATTTGTETDGTTITVSCGTSSKTGTLKVVSTEKCFVVGDIILTDGTKVSVAEVSTYTIDESNKPIGVVTSVPYGGGTGKAIGLQRKYYIPWAKSGTTGYNTNFIDIQAGYSGTSSDGYTFTGDLDGSDNWDYICKIDPEGTLDAATNYPVFNFALSYAETAGLTGTPYENGWYVPSVAEVYEIYKNKDVIQTSLDAAKGFTLGTSWYWSSSQSSSSVYDRAYEVSFNDGYVYSTEKGTVSNYVIVLQALNAK